MRNSPPLPPRAHRAGATDRVCAGLAGAVLVGVLLSSTAHADWNDPRGARVIGGMSPIGHILPVPDGEGGAFVLAIEGASATWIHAQHLAGNGVLAPGWPADGVLVGSSTSIDVNCHGLALRSLDAVPDGAGGVYVAWTGPPLEAVTQASTAWVQHLDENGAVAPGWSPNGTALTTSAGQAELGTCSDGDGGVIVCWRDVRAPLGTEEAPHMMIQHLLADGSLAPGSTALGNLLGSTPAGVHAPRIAAAFAPDPSGGLWALVTRTSTTFGRSGFVVMRIGTNGALASGFGTDGVRLNWLSSDLTQSGTFARLFPDGSGGAWIVAQSAAQAVVFAWHILSTGHFDPTLSQTPLPLAADAAMESAEPDGAGGFFLRHPDVGTTLSSLELGHLLDTGETDPAWASLVPICGERDARLFLTADGAFACGWRVRQFGGCGGVPADAFAGRLRRDGRVPPDWPAGFEDAYNPGIPAGIMVVHDWTDAVAACRDDQAGFLVFWTSSDSPAGEIRAMHYTLGGPLADVPRAALSGQGLSGVRWSRAGIAAIVGWAGAGDADLSVFDLLGRRVAGARVSPAQGSRLVTVPGTAEVRAGLYFVRLRTSQHEFAARAIVVR